MHAATDASRPADVVAQFCPECNAVIPVHSGYVAWCNKCGWNLQPFVPDVPLTLFESTYEALGRRFGKSLFEQLRRAESLRPRLTPARALAYGVAGLVHLFTLVVAALGAGLIVAAWPNIFAVGFGLFLLGVAFVLLPRRAKPYDPEDAVARAEYPTLYKLADEVARALHTRPVDVIVVFADFNAGFAQVGWRRRQVLYLGLPLFNTLSGPERVALLGHELAHGVNGDPNRGRVVGAALQSLQRWYYMLHPGIIVDTSSTIGFIMIPVNLLMLGLATLARIYGEGLLHLLWRDKQRAEYLADALGAQVSGTEPALRLMQKLHLGEVCHLAVRRVLLTRSGQDVFAEMQREMARVPARELERIQRIEQLEGSRLNATHPPTVYRIRMLEAHPVPRPAVTWSAADDDALARELDPARRRLQVRLLDLMEEALYD